ncbi:uncharacterized protein Gasu_59250 [Galdieria sulphuraria]|uniref:Uncharacterized protein n=1 Tax=Galdieria sulphuraria TaxID=130081 RepID=M2XS05_GALSU|nr:uncharacterized protein Gasu_59250 [Galdieria sulphuraria]EME26438.1 hypothetical protein Gasu_59250 [Galdieria sulphuraria]|eukprot:XP_005702958.1 hypothetical protein Gasu_59250 [Galdieria sulphuraria]
MKISKVFFVAIVFAYIGICTIHAQDTVTRQYTEAPTPTPTCTPSAEPWDWDTEKVYKNCENKCLLCYECEQVVSPIQKVDACQLLNYIICQYQFPYFEFIQFLYNFGPSEATPTPTPSSSSYQRLSWKQSIRTYLSSSYPSTYSTSPYEVSSEGSSENGYSTSSSWGYGQGYYTSQPTCSTAPQVRRDIQ